MPTPKQFVPPPAYQFLSPNAEDTMWLVWGKMLHRRGMRGSRIPAEGVRVDVTEHVVRVTGSPRNTYFYTGNVAPCTPPVRSDYPTGSYEFLNPSESVGEEVTSTVNIISTSAGVPTVVNTVSEANYYVSYTDPDNYEWHYCYVGTLAAPLDVYGPVFWAANSVVVAGVGTVTGLTILLYVTDDVTTITAAGDAQYLAARRSVSTTCSANLIANLIGGAVQDSVLAPMRAGHPISALVQQQQLMTSVVVDEEVGDLTTKTVTLSYQSTDVNGNPITLEEEVVGTRLFEYDPEYLETYTNWLPLTPDAADNGSTGVAYDYKYQLGIGDGGDGLAQIWTGTGNGETIDVTVTYPQLYIDYRVEIARIYGSLATDEQALAFIFAALEVTTVEELLAAVGAASIDAWVADEGYSTLTGLAIGLYGMPAPDNYGFWCDSAYQDKETIDIFPLSIVHSELGVLGMFPLDEDIADTSKLTLRVTAKARYTYDYNTGLWTGSGRMLETPITLPYEVGVNVVFRSRAASPWPDVLGPGTPTDPLTYLGQAIDMKATPASYPLFVPLRNL